MLKSKAFFTLSFLPCTLKILPMFFIYPSSLGLTLILLDSNGWKKRVNREKWESIEENLHSCQQAPFAVWWVRTEHPEWSGHCWPISSVYIPEVKRTWAPSRGCNKELNKDCAETKKPLVKIDKLECDPRFPFKNTTTASIKLVQNLIELMPRRVLIPLSGTY